MGAIKTPDVGELYKLELLRTALNAGAILHLFTAPAADFGSGSVVGTFTEASFTGYGSQTIPTQPFGAAATEGDGKAHIHSGTFTFTCSADGSPQTVYGYYVTDALGTTLIDYCFADTPIVIEFNGDVVKVTIDETLYQE